MAALRGTYNLQVCRLHTLKEDVQEKLTMLRSPFLVQLHD